MSDADILNQLDSVDLSTVETSFPILKGGVADFLIAEVIPETDDKGRPLVRVKYTLAQQWETQPHDGLASKPVAVGFPITERIYLNSWTDPKTGEVKNFGITRLAMLREAVFGKASAGTKFVPSELVNQPIKLKLRFDPAPRNNKTGEVYGPQTTVDGYVRKATR